MLVSVAVCPQPPLLVPAVAAGAAAELDDVRAACDAAVTRMLSARPDVVAVLGSAGPRLTTMAPYGVDVPVSRVPLPVAQALGSWLLDRAGYAGPRAYPELPPRLPDARCGLVVMGDGSARHGEKAPGYLDPRAFDFDRSLVQALAGGDPDQLAALDLALAAELLASGAPVFAAFGRLATGAAWDPVLHADAAPYGVGYPVASWLRTS